MSTPQDHRQNLTNWPLVLAGTAVLLIAFLFILFGNRWFGTAETVEQPVGSVQIGGESILEQVPAFEPADRETAVLPTGGEPLRVGDQAYDFTLLDLEGNPHTLAELHGRPVIINFWATWCAPCRIEMPELQATYEKYQDDGLVILAVDQEETADTVADFFYEEMDLTFVPLLDSEGQVAQLYGAVNFPTTFFINSEGIITVLHRGLMVESQIEGYLDQTEPALFADES